MTGKSSPERGAAERLEWLLQSQNRDGGWGYAKGKASWLEPTVYAIRALGAWPLPADAAERIPRALQYVDSLQRGDGAWQASAHVVDVHWSGALWMALASAPRDRPSQWLAGLRWLLAEQGVEGRWPQRLAAWFDRDAVQQDFALRGWPWLAGTASWVEPTCHAMLALRQASRTAATSAVAERLDQGRRLLLDRRCGDGGWNYGNRRVRGQDLPGYPQTTALALLALRRCGAAIPESSVDRARRYWADPSLSRLARVWLALAFRELGIQQQLTDVPPDDTGPIATITASLEAVAWSSGGFV